MLFLREPGFGDDLSYWSLPFQLHEGIPAWSSGSFHHLRWPVWGLCWVLQAIFGTGLVSYYGVPIFYLSVGALIAFVFARRVTASEPIAWASALAFLFEPLIDSVCFRPMPDLSEGIWGSLTVLGWWATMASTRRNTTIAWAAVTGLTLIVLESNRVTGAFIVPVLIVATLVLERRKFGRLVLIGLFAVLCYGVLSAIYHAKTGDWLHDLHANLRNKDAKGIESPALWLLPFRFVDSLWEQGPLAQGYCFLALLGMWQAWRRGGQGGKIVVLWFCVLLLTYSCAPQRLWPYKPMLRDADRFLAALAIPMSVLAAIGLGALLHPIWRIRRLESFPWLRHPVIAGGALLLLLLALTERPFFDLRLVREVRAYIASKPDGTRVLSHMHMHSFIHLVAADEARRMRWVTPVDLLEADAAAEERAAQCDELWFARKLLWLSVRKRLEKQRVLTQPPLPSYFDAPEHNWVLAQVIAKGDAPDLVFYRRRAPSDPPAVLLGATAAEWQGLIPSLPITWKPQKKKRYQVPWTVPKAWLGKPVELVLRARSAQVEPFTIEFTFTSANGKTEYAEYELKPYLFPEEGKNFFAFVIPATAEKCVVTVIFDRKAAAVEFLDFHATLAAPALVAP
jgi:hypothetical protein